MVDRIKTWLGSTLTRKFTLVLVCFLALQAIQLSVGIFSLMHLGEESRLINEAGKQRTRLVWLHHLVHVTADTGLTPSEREQFAELIEEQDAVFARLRRHAEKPFHGYLNKNLAVARAHWERSVKPLLAAFQTPDAAGARAASARLVTLILDQLAQVDRVVGEYQQNAAGDARDLARFQGIILGFNLLLGVIGLVMARQVVTRPLRDLIRCTEAIAAGAYDQHVETRSRDELGKLADNFNRMAAAVSAKTARLAALNRIAESLNSTLSLEDILDRIMYYATDVIHANAACIAFYDERSGRFTEWVTQGLSDQFKRSMAFRPGGLADEIFETGRHVLCNDRPETKHKLSKLARDEGIRSIVCLPLTSDSRRLGVIYVYRKDRDEFSGEEIELLTAFAHLAAGAISNARLHALTTEQARTDGLTGLCNRREFDERLETEFRRAQRYAKPFAFLFFDIDRFKRVNDRYGHEAGDAILKTLAGILSEQFRDVDIVARYGGEEFVVILPEIDGGTAKGVAERVRRAVAGTPFRLPGGREVSVTVSIGVSCFPACASAPEEIVARADQSLYIAKQAGRNRIVLYRDTLKARIEQDPDLIVEMLTRSLDNILPIVTAVSCKAPFFRRHTDKVVEVAAMLARALGLSRDECKTLRLAGLLHDVGMVTVPDSVLSKTTPLSPDEWELVKGHAASGAEFLQRVSALRHLAPLVRHHHERYDGRGYPDGLKGEDLPRLARALAVADAYGAMIADWPGRKAVSPVEARARLRAGAGAQFDPEMVKALIQALEAVDQPDAVKATA